ncbi:MAG: metallophosphoesterase family protein [Bacteroidetes bacterium]|nr:metallophosphoesterase family protein [Bacteroidota bacterium]
MRIGLISDTHSYIDPRVYDLFKDCDEVWHAGDFGEGLETQFRNFKVFRGVYGNIDGQKMRAVYPEELFFTCEEVKVYMIHIGGSPGNYYPQAKKGIESFTPGLFICGHSHILKVMQDKKYNMLYMNPGAAGKHGFHKMRTLLRFEINGKKIEKLEAIELGLRGNAV